MPKITYEVGGMQAVEDIHPDLIPFYENRPGYTVVVDELAAAVLKGDDLDRAARELAGITDPGHTPAAEKRAAIVEATAPTGDGLPLTPAPPAVLSVDTTKSRAAADTEN